MLSSDTGSVVMCEPIAMEILSGAASDVVYEKFERLINGLPSLVLDESVDFRSAATIYRSARRQGMTIRSINDCVIAAVAIRHGAELVHRDADFDVIASFTQLTARGIR